jgi:hypothetical protein
VSGNQLSSVQGSRCMRILAAIPHYYSRSAALSPDGRAHGSVGPHADSRVAALRACLASLHQLYGPAQHMIDQATRVALLANSRTVGKVEVVVCTAGDDHLLDRLNLPAGSYRHKRTESPPALLGFECHALLRDRLGDYDYFAYLEDDLISRDPWLFVKLAWFTAQLGDDVLLQPNRYEINPLLGLVHKAYIDGDLHPNVTAPFQDILSTPVATASLLGTTIAFQRAKNPHAGCFFLNDRQLRSWSRQPDFLDRDTSFIGPLESAATLGVMRTFRVYKTAPESAGFFEIEHFGTSFLENLRRRGDTPKAADRVP